MSRRLIELAGWVGGAIDGDGELVILGLRGLAEAGPEDLSFLANPRYRALAVASRAGALLVRERVEGFAGTQVVVGDPYRAFAAILARLNPPAPPLPGIHATAVVGPGAEIDPSAHLGPFAVVGERSRVAAGAVVHPHVVVGRDCEVGEGSVLHPHVVLYDGTKLGRRVVVHAGTILGSDGFGYASEGGLPVKIPQVGHVEVGDDVEIGANTAVDRATLGVTSIGAHSKIDNLVQIAHNVQVGRAAILCGQAGIAGSARLGDGVVLAGQAGVVGHVELGKGVRVAAKSAVFDSVPAGTQVAGIPAEEAGAWRRQVVMLRRLVDLGRRLRRLERQAETSAVGREETAVE